ncbi:polysaccharide biosynthesis protein [Neobacillus notoginsengisoli]|uniref:Polysaccharide biosynthesis protein n=1 Tax=Neobacillus notoginsengisoli TaxID=1578198 RepID=A0A417YYP8_9BACI|nr:oligosaccharide flippase family protein [Neobacillus notoginsengisoli]RHW42765.1 polysaccharide biosynthesis protein [Neobacillus notoginsengisoli]
MSAHIKSNRISRDTIIYIPVFLAPAIINIILLMIFTRFFSPKEYGTYTIVVNTTIILSSVLAQWIVLSVQRFRPEYSHNGTIREFNRNLNRLLLFISMGFLAAAVIFYPFLPSGLVSYRDYYWSSVLLIISTIYFTVLGGVYQVDLQSKQFRNLNVIQSIMKLVIILIFVMAIYYSPVSFIWGTLAAQALVTIPMLRYAETGKMFRSMKAAKDSFFGFGKKFWRYGFPLIGWYIGTTVMNLTDRFMIEYFRSSHEVGIYSANFTIAVQAIALICNPLFFAIQPIMMNEIQQHSEQEHIERRISNFTHLFIIIAMPFGVYFSIYRHEISELLLGNQFTSGAIIIPILIIGFFAWNIGLYGQLAYQIAKRTKEMFYFVFIAALTNFTLNLYFIPKWGFIGAAISTTIGFFVYSGLLAAFAHRFIKWKIPWMAFSKVFLLVLVVGFPFFLAKALYQVNVSPLLKMISGLPFFLIYAGAVFILWKNAIREIISSS